MSYQEKRPEDNRHRKKIRHYTRHFAICCDSLMEGRELVPGFTGYATRKQAERALGVLDYAMAGKRQAGLGGFMPGFHEFSVVDLRDEPDLH